MNLLDLALTHPVFTFCMAWPIGLVIVFVSWHIAITLENVMNMLLGFGRLAVMMVHGYETIQPPSNEATQDDPQ